MTGQPLDDELIVTTESDLSETIEDLLDNVPEDASVEYSAGFADALFAYVQSRK